MKPLYPPRSLAAEASGLDRLLGPAILVAAALLAAGWMLPVMTVERFFFLNRRVSILEGARDLWLGGHYALCLVLVVFSMIFPAFKLLLAGYLWYGGQVAPKARHSLVEAVDKVGRWSMLDVFVVALIVVAAQLSIVSDVALHGGIYSFAAAVLLSMVAVRRLAFIARAAAGGAAPTP